MEEMMQMGGYVNSSTLPCMSLQDTLWKNLHSSPEELSPTDVSAQCSDDGESGYNESASASYSSRLSPLLSSSPQPLMVPRTQLGCIVEVRFKCTKDNYKITDQIHGEIKIGDSVVVEADRGFDAGVVHDIRPPAPVSIYAPSQHSPLRRVVSLASIEDKQLMQANAKEEERALQLCRHLAQVRHIPITVAAAEMQFDRKKLTIIFSSDRRVDFRELVRDMFQAFKTRIWMQKVSPSEATTLAFMFPTAPLAPAAVPLRIQNAPRSSRQVYTPPAPSVVDGQMPNAIPYVPTTALKSSDSFRTGKPPTPIVTGYSIDIHSAPAEVQNWHAQGDVYQVRDPVTTPGGSASSLRVDSAYFYPSTNYLSHQAMPQHYEF